MRQAGVLAAAGIVALETMRHRLVEDHANTRRLADGLQSLRPHGPSPPWLRTRPHAAPRSLNGAAVVGDHGATCEATVVDFDPASIQTNMLMVDLVQPDVKTEDVLAHMRQKGLLAFAVGPRRLRFVLHHHVTGADVDHAAKIMHSVLGSA